MTLYEVDDHNRSFPLKNGGSPIECVFQQTTARSEFKSIVRFETINERLTLGYIIKCRYWMCTLKKGGRRILHCHS